jgi:hypothetical protein
MTTLDRSPDRRTLHFGPWGLTGAVPPEFSRRLLQEEVDWMELGDRVPKPVRSQFQKLKGTYLDGLYRYEHFTAAERDSYRVLEVALKTRFLEHYGRQIPLVIDGNERVVAVHRFEDVRGRVAHSKARLSGHPRFNGSLASLLKWARAEGYFYGQLNRTREQATLRLRNEVQHTEHDLLVMPPDAGRSLGLLFQWIQRLWGYDTPGGDAYPGAVPRGLWVVGLGPLPGEATWLQLGYVPQAADDERDRRAWYVVLAVEGEHLGSWRLGFDCTEAPVDQVWGPGSWEQLSAAEAQNCGVWATDAVELLDRLFFVRTLPEAMEAPRSAAQVSALRDPRSDERWTVVRADWPAMAMHHLTGYTPGPHTAQGPCRSCAVEVVMSGSTRETIDRYLSSLA